MSDNKKPIYTTPAELQRYVDTAVGNLRALVGERGAVIVMISGQQEGGHDTYYVAYGGPTLTVMGLKEQAGNALAGLLKFNPVSTDVPK